MKDNTIEIESIMVEVEGDLFDIVSFSDPKAAAAYRKSMERWGAKSGKKVKVWSQKSRVSGQAHQGLASRLKPAIRQVTT